MAENTAIEWCDATFNPWWGCQKVSPACDHCYAERDAQRYAPGRVLWGVDSERRTFGDDHWEMPIKWARAQWFQCLDCGNRYGIKSRANRRSEFVACGRCGSKRPAAARRRVFCASMGDWLDLTAPIAEFVRLLDTIRLTPELDWLLLSKRVGNWRKRLEEAARKATGWLRDWIIEWLGGLGPANVWVGATVVNQAEADRDITKLLAVPARVRFLSIEPMLGPIDLRPMFEHRADHHGDTGVHWVICGGESGPKARPMHPDWACSLREQCAAAGVPYLFKQWGEWAPCTFKFEMVQGRDVMLWPDGTDGPGSAEDHGGLAACMERVGKKAAGRLLDGVEHNGFPEAPHA